MAESNGNGQGTLKLAANTNTALTPQECELVYNLNISRLNFFKQFLDPRRNVLKECGIPDVDTLNKHDYQTLYATDGIAARVVEVLPLETWKRQPQVYEDESPDKETEFETAWDELGKSLRGDSLRKEEAGSAVWEYLLRLDMLSGVGHFGVMLLGLDDGKPLSEPADGIDEKGSRTKSRKERKLTYVRVFSEHLVDVTKWESDPTNPRYGQPTEYAIQLNDPTDLRNGIGIDTKSANVHWSRAIHVADNLTSSEVVGNPRLKTVLPWIVNLQKLYHGSAEGYWKGCFPGLSLETHPELGADGTIDRASMSSAVERFQNSSQRYLLLEGVHANMIAPSSTDPSSQIEAELNAICIRIPCPKRVFEGSERGELASSQDDDTWTERLIGRQAFHVSPRIIAPFVDRCIALGVLPVPKEYTIHWPDLKTMGEEQKSKIALTKVQTMAAYVGGGLDVLMAPKTFYTQLLEVSDEEAEAILEDAVDHTNEANPEAPDVTVPGQKPENPLEAAQKQASIEVTRAKAEEIKSAAKGKAPPPKPTENVEDILGEDKELETNAKTGSGGPNCGTGAGGFKPSNKCALGGHAGVKAFQERKILTTPPPPATEKSQRTPYVPPMSAEEQIKANTILEAANQMDRGATRQHVATLNEKMQKHDAALESMREAVLKEDTALAKLEKKRDKLSVEADKNFTKYWELTETDPEAAKEFSAKVMQDTADKFEKINRKVRDKHAALRDNAHKALAKELDSQRLTGANIDNIVTRSEWGNADTTYERSKPFLSGVVGKTHEPYLKVQAFNIPDHEEQRAFHREGHDFVGGGRGSGIFMDKHSGNAVFIHEFGHAIETDIQAGRLARAFVAKRTEGAEFVSLQDKFGGSYKYHEVGAEDDFGKTFGKGSAYAHYAGKYYPHGATEITSMGLQKLYEDPVGFARSDPEYFKLTVGIVSGKLIE